MAIDLDISGARPFFYILIGGLGVKEGTEAKQVYTFTRTPDWAPTATQKFIGGLHIPNEWSQGVDLWGGIATGSNLTIELQDFPQTSGAYFWAELFALGRWAHNPSAYPQTFVVQTIRPVDKALYAQPRPSNEFPRTDTATSADRTIFVGLETMRYTTIDFVEQAAFSADRYSPLVRNLFPAFGELALEHAVQNIGEAKQPVITTVPRNLFGRTIGVYCGLQYPDGTWSVEADSLRLFAGTIQQAEWMGEKGRWRLQCDDMLALLDVKCCTYLGRRRYVTDPISGAAEPTGVVASSTLRGIQLGVSPKNRIHVKVRTTGGTLIRDKFRDMESDTRGNWFSILDNLVADINIFLGTMYDDPAPHTVSLHLRWNDDATKLNFDVTCSVDCYVRVVLGQALAYCLGFSKDGKQEYNKLQDAWPTATFDADDSPRNNMIWLPDGVESGSHNKLTVNDHAWFYEGNQLGIYITQGDGVPPAVIVGDSENGLGLLRYRTKEFITDVDAAGIFSPREVLGDIAEFSASNTYGPVNCWPGSGQGLGKQLDGDEGHAVAQVLAPNPDRNVFWLILELMLSTGYGYTIGDQISSADLEYQFTPLNGNWDVFPPGVGAAIPESLVDTQSFLDIAAQFDSAMLRRGYVFTEAFALKDFIDREAKLLGFTVAIENGKITARVVPSLSSGDDIAATFDETNRSKDTDRTSSMLATRNVLNAMTFSFHWGLQKKEFAKVLNLNFPISQAENRVVRSVQMENRGVYGGLTDIAERFGTAMTLRQSLYGWPLFTLRRSYVFRLWTALAPGQIVRIHDGRPDVTVSGLKLPAGSDQSGVPDPFTGNLGLYNRLAAVTSVSYNYHGAGGSVELVLLPIQAKDSYITTTGEIVDDGRVASLGTTAEVLYTRGDGGWDSATRTLYVFDSIYSTAPAHDLDGIAAGMFMRVTDTSAADADNPPSALVSLASVTKAFDGTSNVVLVEDLGALLPGGFVVGHRYVMTEDPYAAPVVEFTRFYFRDTTATGSNFGKMTKDDSSGISIAMTGTGWTVATFGAGTSRNLQYGAEVTGFAVVSPEVVPPDNATLKNCWRSEAKLTGTFPAGDWTFAAWVKAVTAGGAMDGHMVFRLYRSVNADGSSATEITSADQACGDVTNLTTTTEQLTDKTIALQAVTVAAEYLFVSMSWHITGAGGGATHDCLIEIGNPSGIWTALTAPPFAASPPAEQYERAFMADDETSFVAVDKAWNPYA